MMRKIGYAAILAGAALAGRCAENELPPLDKWSPFPGTNNVCVTIKYDKPDRRPIWFGAQSCCTNASGDEYAMFLDLIEEGDPEWGVKANFSQGTHGWESVERVFEPKRPVKEIRCYLFLRRDAKGQVWFDKPFLKRAMPLKGHCLSSARRTLRPYAEAEQVEAEVSDGARLVKEVRRQAVTLALPCPLPSEAQVAWVADSMRRVSPLAFPTAAEQKAPNIRLDLARGERESAQICISTGAKATAQNVRAMVSPLRTSAGVPFAGTVDVRRLGYLARKSGYAPHPDGPAAVETWFAEPLLPNAPLTVSPASTRGFWLTAHASRTCPAGLYEGHVTVSSEKRPDAVIPISVRVRTFALPEHFGLKTAFSVMDGFTRAAYPNDFGARKRESWDLMLDCRLNPDDISRTTPPDLDDLVYARSRGMCSFNVLNLVPPPKDPKARWVCWASPNEVFSASTRAYFQRTLKPYVAELKKRGLDRLGYLYGFDERGKEFYPQMLDLWHELADATSLPLMTTAYMFQDVKRGNLKEDSPLATMTDWHCPLLSVYDAALADRYRAKGREVWVYTCCGPHYPHLNCASYEYPLVECRVLGWMMRALRADGFLFWHVNLWPANVKLDERETFFPKWNTHSSLHMPGDGVFLYPGKEHVLPGIRLANLRDAVEDYEWLQLAERKAGRAAVEALLRRIARTSSDFTRDPALVRSVRSALADMIE